MDYTYWGYDAMFIASPPSPLAGAARQGQAGPPGDAPNESGLTMKERRALLAIAASPPSPPPKINTALSRSARYAARLDPALAAAMADNPSRDGSGSGSGAGHGDNSGRVDGGDGRDGHDGRAAAPAHADAAAAALAPRGASSAGAHTHTHRPETVSSIIDAALGDESPAAPWPSAVLCERNGACGGGGGGVGGEHNGLRAGGGGGIGGERHDLRGGGGGGGELVERNGAVPWGQLATDKAHLSAELFG
jgi:hypothetical protein